MRTRQWMRYGIGLAVSFWIWSVLLVYAQGPGGARGIYVVPDEEKRSVIQEADGFSYLGGDITLNQAKVQALADAKRNAAEAVLTYVQSNTKVENFEVQYDVILSKAEAAIRVIDQKDQGIVDNTRYHVWIKAEVFYDLASKAEKPDMPLLMDEKAPLTVKIWTEKKRYKKGERIVIHMRGNKDYFARIVDKTSTGELVQLLPNRFRQANHFKGGEIYTIPGEGDRFELEVGEPYGKDRILVYASEAALADVPMRVLGGSGLQAFDGGEEELAQRMRGISVVAGDGTPSSEPVAAEASGTVFYEAVWEVWTAE
ncbi:MAG: DUF4384 domain-containing protein [Deltaproteobacteria bacterium]|nr:DUF4384 domain-containing protein [Deltaproteobacteria bacterium]